jgi:serine/threonine-protein kinase
MSTVRIAMDRRLEREVAVKLLAEHLADDPQFVTRFRREALSAARLVHPNIVQVFDFGLDERSGSHYIVMELVRGKSGAELLREEGRLTVSAAVEIVTQSCLGLDYAHRNGVVHRDVKPGNLLRSTEGHREARGLRDRQGVRRGELDHPGRVRPGHRLLPGARAGPRARTPARAPTSTRSGS